MLDIGGGEARLSSFILAGWVDDLLRLSVDGGDKIVPFSKIFGSVLGDNSDDELGCFLGRPGPRLGAAGCVCC